MLDFQNHLWLNKEVPVVKAMWLPLVGLLMGLLIGRMLSLEIPAAFSHYYAVSLLVIFDTIVGGMKAGLNNRFRASVFWTGFLTNIFFAILLTYLGDSLGVELYLAVLFAFGFRIIHGINALRALLFPGNKSDPMEKREK